MVYLFSVLFSVAIFFGYQIFSEYKIGRFSLFKHVLFSGSVGTIIGILLNYFLY